MAGSPSASRILPLALALAALAILLPAAAPASASEVRTVDLGGIEARSAALLLSGAETGELEASFLARPLAPSPAGTAIQLVADLVGASLLEAAAGPQMIVEVYAYALDDAGQPRATLTRAFRIDLPVHRAQLETGGVKFLGSMALPAGIAVHTLRLLVLHRASGRFALRTLPLPPTIAQPEAADARTRPTVLEHADPWILASGGDSLRPTADKDLWLPATRLVATAGGSLSLGLAVADTAGVVGQLLDMDGQLLGNLNLRSPRAPENGLSAREIVLQLSEWPPGSYLLEVAGDGRSEPAPRLPLELVSEQLAVGTAWFQRPPAPEEQVEVGPGTQLGGRSALAQLALAAYHRAFESWLAGSLEDALAELRRFETGATSSSNSVGLSIEEGQVRAAAELVAEDDEALVPLMCLHELLFRQYQKNDSYLLATHAQRLASEFARLYAARGGPEAGRIAALVQVSLAGLRQEIGARSAAQSTFENALELDPRQPAALLGLAALHESFAHYETAVELLRRLDRVGAMSPAAKIRLAVNLGRVGSTRQALELLGELAGAAAGLGLAARLPGARTPPGRLPARRRGPDGASGGARALSRRPGAHHPAGRFAGPAGPTARRTAGAGRHRRSDRRPRRLGPPALQRPANAADRGGADPSGAGGGRAPAGGARKSPRDPQRRRPVRLAGAPLVILAAAFLTATVAAQAPPAEETIRVFLDKPDRTVPAFGSVEVVASVGSDEPVARIVIYVDGIVAAELDTPPYVTTVEVGTENRRHRFEAIAHTVSGATARTFFTTPRIRVDEEVTISLQQLYVTVTRDDRRVTGLTQDQFNVTDQGRRQELVTFARGDIPFTAAVLLDSSISMAGDKLRAALAGAKAFFERMSPLDEGRLIVFSDRILHSSPFTSYPEVLSAGLGGVQAAGGTALADHLYLALKQLQARQGRRVVILLSDGVDSHSVLSMADALAQARRSQALIYWLRLPYGSGSTDTSGLPRLSSAWRDSADYDREFTLLSQTVQESGGRIATLAAMSEIGPAFEEIRQELREQYVLGYYPTAKRRDGSWRKVQVRLSDSSLEVRVRDGYNDF